jgi:hypothetical protein
VRIDTSRTGSINGRSSAARSGPGVAFQVNEGSTPVRSQGMAPMAGMQDIGSLLALQSVEDPLARRKRQVRRGTDMLDLLERMKADLVVGLISPGRLDQMQRLLADVRERGEPGLDQLLDDIELRVAVELAKRGR